MRFPSPSSRLPAAVSRIAALSLAILSATGLSGQQASQERDLKTVLETGEVVSKSVTIPRSYALVVGIGPYGKLPEDSWLNYAERDADAIYRILISPEGGNFRAENVHRLDRRTTRRLENLTRDEFEVSGCLRSAQPGRPRAHLLCRSRLRRQRQGRAYLALRTILTRTPSRPPAIRWIGSARSSARSIRSVKDKILLTDACHSGRDYASGGLEGENNEAINKLAARSCRPRCSC